MDSTISEPAVSETITEPWECLKRRVYEALKRLKEAKDEYTSDDSRPDLLEKLKAAEQCVNNSKRELLRNLLENHHKAIQEDNQEMKSRVEKLLELCMCDAPYLYYNTTETLLTDQA